MSRKGHDARRAGGLLLAFVLVVSQASAWFHAAAIAHVACAEHGEAVHGGALAGEPGAARVGEGEPGAHADLAAAAGHDHCANAALLRWRDVALTAPPAIAPVVFVSRSLPVAPFEGVSIGTAVYLIAPKTSPPSSSV